jgi:hypothetical protein
MNKTWLALLLLFAISGGLHAQSTGTINGRVADPTGGVVAGANVTATNSGTGIARNTVTDSDGLYTIPALTPGMYNVKVELTGFAKAEKDNETLVTATTLTVNFDLGLATTASSVEVTSEAPMIELTQSLVSETLQTSEVQNLPILNRNFSGLITLVPSARPTLPTANGKIMLGGGIGFSGGAGRNGAAEVDGVAFRDDVNGGPLFNVTLEGVQEFNVLSHDYPAQYGLTSGGIVLITTKSGGNQFHGSAFGFGRNQAMTAIDYFSETANGGSGVKPPYSREEFGGSLGGRIIKDKLFFFGGIEDVRLDQSITVPAASVTQAQLVKTTLASYTTCAICQTVSSLIGPSNYVPESIRDLMSSVRVDYQINNHHSLFARWSRQHISGNDDILQQIGGTPHPDINPTSSNNVDQIQADSAVLSETWVIGNNSVNTFAVAGNHFHGFQACNCTLTGAAQIYRNMTFPDLQLGSPLPSVDTDNFQADIQIKDTFAHQMGNHALKFGGDFINYTFLGLRKNNSGSVAFFADPSAILANPTTYPQGFLTPGAMKTILISTANFGGAPALSGVQHGKEFSWFVQDDWKIRPGFTLNLGLHYGQFINFYDQSSQQNNRSRQALAAIGSPWGSPVHADTTAYSPRVGFAWDVTGNGKNVVRGSFGIFFDESLSPNMTAISPLSQPILQNVQSTFTNTAVGVGAAASTVYGGTLPGTLTPGLSSLLPGGNTTITWLEPGTRDPYNEQTHIGYTRQLASSSVLSVDYTHILGMHEWQPQQINPFESSNWDPNAASFNTCGLTGKWRRNECAFRAAGYAPNTIGAVQINSSTNRSQYNEMIVHFEQRSKHLDLQASYILSYAYAFGGAIGGTVTAGSPAAAEIPFQWFTPTQWGPTLTDERNRVVISGVIRMPWGIEASPVFQYGSARPYNCLSATDWTGSGGNDSRCIMNSSGTVIPAPAAFPFPAGDTAVNVNSLRGSATYDLDARFTKVFSIRESMKLNVFAELYNITNRVNFGNNYSGTCTASATNPSACSSTFEAPLGYLNNGFSLPTSRQLQLGARFTF